MFCLDCNVKTHVDYVVLDYIEESPYTKSEFIRRCLHSVFNNDDVFDELISQESFVNEVIVEFLESMLEYVTDKINELIEDNRRIYDEYCHIREVELNNKKYDERTVEAINSIKGIIDRGCTVNMNMIKFNARKCYMSTDNFLKVLRGECVKI